jgi:putative nucleotidyltransferase with HDIG domain
MGDMNAIRDGVRKSLPEIQEIKSKDLRDKVVEAWALALDKSGLQRVEDIPPTGVPGSSPLKRHTQADHMRATATIAMGIADGLEKVMGPTRIDRDILIAGAICHDLGKTYEFSAENQARWRKDPAAAGNPAIRHPAYGVYIGLTVGLPEAVVHAIGYHSTGAEGETVVRSLENHIVTDADYTFWKLAESAGLTEGPMFSRENTIVKIGLIRK